MCHQNHGSARAESVQARAQSVPRWRLPILQQRHARNEKHLRDYAKYRSRGRGTGGQPGDGALSHWYRLGKALGQTCVVMKIILSS